MQLASVADHFVAVVAKLRDAGLTVGEGEGRDNRGNVLSAPYVTVSSTSSDGRRGPVGAPFDDARLEFHTKCVSTSARGAEVLRDQVAAALLAGVSVAGRRVEVWQDLAVGVVRDPDVHELFQGDDRWTLWTTPA